MGFSNFLFEFIMTSGEALWRDIAYKKIKEENFFPIERNLGDAKVWANGLEISLECSINSAQAILLMGLFNIFECLIPFAFMAVFRWLSKSVSV